MSKNVPFECFAQYLEQNKHWWNSNDYSGGLKVNCEGRYSIVDEFSCESSILSVSYT